MAQFSIKIWSNFQLVLTRIKTDSVLLRMKSDYVNFINSDQIDSLRILLEVKEKHLCRIMEAVQSWEDVDSFIVNEFPINLNFG